MSQRRTHKINKSGYADWDSEAVSKPNGSRSTLEARLGKLRNNLRLLDPQVLADRSGGIYVPPENGTEIIVLNFWDKEILVYLPDFIAFDKNSGMKLELASHTLLSYYLNMTDGTPIQDNWISFSDLPNGRFYVHAFQGYTGDKLSRCFNDDLVAFDRASTNVGGKFFSLGSTAYIFDLFPHVKLLVVAWLGDEDISTKYQILFNNNTHHHLPTDACAIAGSILTNRLIRAV